MLYNYLFLEFNVPFQHKYGYIREKSSGVDSYPYPVKEGRRYINLNPGHLFVQQLILHVTIIRPYRLHSDAADCYRCRT